MANTFLTVKEIARTALLRLRANEVMTKFVNRDFQDEFKKRGDTIQARVPFVAVANDFTTSISTQDINEQSVDIKLDKIADVSFEITSKQKTLSIEDFQFEVIDPAVVALAEKIDQDLNGLYIDVPFFFGTGGTTPSTLSSLAGVRKVLADNKVPNSLRHLVIDTTAAAALLSLDSLVEIDKSGMSETLRDAVLGRIYGFQLAESQHIKDHTAGGYSVLGDVTAAGTADDFSVVLTSAAGTSTDVLLKGDLLDIDGNQHVVTADTVAAVAGVVSAEVYPAVPVGGYPGTGSGTVTFVPDHTANLAFHRNAFTLAVRPMALPSGGADGYVTSFDGLSLRVVQDYDAITKKEIISFDILYGMKVTQPTLAARLLG